MARSPSPISLASIRSRPTRPRRSSRETTSFTTGPRRSSTSSTSPTSSVTSTLRRRCSSAGCLWSSVSTCATFSPRAAMRSMPPSCPRSSGSPASRSRHSRRETLTRSSPVRSKPVGRAFPPRRAMPSPMTSSMRSITSRPPSRVSVSQSSPAGTRSRSSSETQRPSSRSVSRGERLPRSSLSSKGSRRAAPMTPSPSSPLNATTGLRESSRSAWSRRLPSSRRPRGSTASSRVVRWDYRSSSQ